MASDLTSTGYKLIISSFPGLLVALRYCLHGGFSSCSSCFTGDGKSGGDPRLPEQPDQPLPLHDHQQRREVSVEEDIPVWQPEAPQTAECGHGGVIKY